jgi:prepilin-type N-terminal cleavage/methylation domain-containing protein
MRPTGKRWLGPKQQPTNISGRERIAKRCEGARRYQLGWISGQAGARPARLNSRKSYRDLSRRNYRTQPRVLIPGTVSKDDPSQRGGRVRAARAELPAQRNSRTKICRPFPPSSLVPELRRTGRAMPDVDMSPGLKPRAESYHPSGIKRVAYRNSGLSLVELLVVLTIIAAISALITTSIMSALKQQNQRICLNNMLTIEAAKDEYIRDHPGATSIPDSTSFQQYFKFGIPRCPDGGNYENLLSLTQPVNCSIHGSVSVSPTPTP